MNDNERPNPLELAAYIRDFARELGVSARELGMSDLADALERAERAAEDLLQSPANAAPEDAT
ncbi:MAG: hypothetical protein R3C16_02795 [Hyphomonadaceae bacterium]